MKQIYEKNADLIIEDYKTKNPDDKVEITATPVTGRVDRWMIIRDKIPFPTEYYTLNQIKALGVKKAEKKKASIIEKQRKGPVEFKIPSPEEIAKLPQG